MQMWLDRLLLLVIVTSIVVIVVTAIALFSRAEAAESNTANVAPALAITR